MVTFRDQRGVGGNDILERIQHELPLHIRRWRRKHELNRFMVSVDQQQKRVVENRIAQVLSLIHI